MADSKISALPASTVPLAGTEVLPIVQSSTTKQVSVANLTAGRAISATQVTLTTGNLIVASGQGIDFSATSHPAGMTSELLNDYEEGTWTPSLGGDTTYSTQVGTYTKIGRVVVVNFAVGVTTLGTGSATDIAGLPYTVFATNRGAGNVAYVLSPASAFASINPHAFTSNTGIRFLCSSILGAYTDQAAVFASGTIISGTVTYFT